MQQVLKVHRSSKQTIHYVETRISKVERSLRGGIKMLCFHYWQAPYKLQSSDLVGVLNARTVTGQFKNLSQGRLVVCIMRQIAGRPLRTLRNCYAAINLYICLYFFTCLITFQHYSTNNGFEVLNSIT